MVVQYESFIQRVLMIDCNNTVTHARWVVDEEKRDKVLVSELIKNCSWNHVYGTRDGEKEDTEDDSFTVRIEVNVANDIPDIKKHDILILGEADIQGMTSAQLQRKYPESFEVQTVKYNLNSVGGYSNHIRIQGV